jgi:hypothetical protein
VSAAAQPLIRPAPTALEAAAIVAALERFARDTAPPPAPPATAGGWLRAARLEAVGRSGDSPAIWGE